MCVILSRWIFFYTAFLFNETPTPNAPYPVAQFDLKKKMIFLRESASLIAMAFATQKFDYKNDVKSMYSAPFPPQKLHDHV